MPVGVAIIGAGAIALANHLPGLRLCPEARLVALCDTNSQTLQQASDETGVSAVFQDYRDCLSHDGVDAVIVATPNNTHPAIVLDAISAGKHVLCEKPLALDYPTAKRMYESAQAAGVRHMTAFTYRFVPAMRYAHHLVRSGAIGRVFHFRAQRFQDWGNRTMGWRQVAALAGSGELGDMLSHRIDYAHHLVGRFTRVVADLRNFIPTRGGKPSDVDDWVAAMGDLENGATAVLESTKLATGRGSGHGGLDLVELNGEEATVVYSTQRPLELEIARRGKSETRAVAVPREFLVWPGSPRDPDQGDPLVSFRYDQSVEFIHAIVEDRDATPSFKEGSDAQLVMDCIIRSAREQRWVDVVPGRE